MLKNYQRKTKFFEFLGDSCWEELNIKKQHDCAMVSLCNDTMSLYDEYVA